MVIRKKTFAILLLTLIGLFATTGCDLVPLHMRNQPKVVPYKESGFFADDLSARPIPANTILFGEQGEQMVDEVFFTGKDEAGEYVPTIPVAVTDELVLRGQERYNIYCAPCHDAAGAGNGVIVKRGFKAPPSFHQERLRDVEDGYYFDVMTNGFGVMYDYAARINPADRWAIVAYVRALQISQYADINDVSDELRAELESSK